MIVKNEAHIIHEALTCTLPLIQTYCIVDTGSTDNTIQIIKDFYSARGIEGAVHEREWKNFGVNRTQALNLCDGKMDYALVIDADDLIGFPENGNAIFQDILQKQQPNSCNIIIKQGGIEYWRSQVFKCNDGWGYVGVLHEYPANNKPNNKVFQLPREFWMESRRLGGRNLTGDKPKKDIELLEQGLRDEPNNERYMFYLGQSYRDAGDFVNAIKYYKQRFHIGRWHEEAWFAAYQVGLAYKHLGNIFKFEYWMQKAHAFRPTRAEPMYHLTEHFRVTGQLFKAYEYCKIGSQIPYPKDDVLFVEQFPHKGAFGYEKTVLDFYVHDDRRIGLRDSTNYLLKNGEHMQNVLSNLQFYAKPILNYKVEQLNIAKPFGDDFRPSAISVLNYPFANIRYVNYLVPENNVYKTKDGGPIQTQNAYVNLDTGDVIRKMQDASIDLPRLSTNVKGLEDIRLFTENNEVKFVATTMREYDPNIRIVTGNYNFHIGTYSNVSVLNSPNNVQCEKNWLPVPSTDHIIYNWCPLQIIKADGTRVTTHDTPPLFSLFRGSTIPIRWNSNWLVMVHFAEYSTPRKYYHCLVELEMNTYAPLKISLPFVFKNPSIEYCLSMRLISETTLECYPSFMDSNLSKYTFSLNSVEWAILIEKPQSSVVRVPANVGVYWAGKFSQCRPSDSIETFVNKLKPNKPTSFLFFQNDGIMSDDNYRTVVSTSIESRMPIIPESMSKHIESSAQPNTIPIICALSTRGTTKNNILLLPLDDAMFEYGISHIFKNVDMISWEKRRPQIFWRGNLGGYERPSIRENILKKLLDNIHSDVKFAFLYCGGSYVDSIDKKYVVEKRSDLQDYVHYKYLLIIDGVNIASNHQWTFGSGSVPVMITHPDNNWWFKQYLKPMVNYVPIQYDLSDLEEKIQWLVDNDEQAHTIAMNAVKLSQEIFTSNFQKEYVTNEANRLLTLL